jgi:putative flippase GtrA
VPAELRRFLVVGGLTVLCDYLVYRGLLLAIDGIDLAKALGFVAGTVFAYFANRRFTFDTRSAHGRQPVRFAALYLFTLGANVAVNAACVRALAGFGFEVALAFLVATGVSATLNFVGMKYWVFAAKAA